MTKRRKRCDGWNAATNNPCGRWAMTGWKYCAPCLERRKAGESLRRPANTYAPATYTNAEEAEIDLRQS